MSLYNMIDGKDITRLLEWILSLKEQADKKNVGEGRTKNNQPTSEVLQIYILFY